MSRTNLPIWMRSLPLYLCLSQVLLKLQQWVQYTFPRISFLPIIHTKLPLPSLSLASVLFTQIAAQVPPKLAALAKTAADGVSALTNIKGSIEGANSDMIVTALVDFVQVSRTFRTSVDIFISETQAFECWHSQLYFFSLSCTLFPTGPPKPSQDHLWKARNHFQIRLRRTSQSRLGKLGRCGWCFRFCSHQRHSNQDGQGKDGKIHARWFFERFHQGLLFVIFSRSHLKIKSEVSNSSQLSFF